MEVSNEDMEVAELCQANGKFLYSAFLCQQAVEKALKAIINSLGSVPDPIHNLTVLASTADVWEYMTPEQQEFLRELTVYAVQARYPERKKKLVSLCTEQKANRILRFSKEVIAWLKQRLNDELSHGK